MRQYFLLPSSVLFELGYLDSILVGHLGVGMELCLLWSRCTSLIYFLGSLFYLGIWEAHQAGVLNCQPLLGRMRKLSRLDDVPIEGLAQNIFGRRKFKANNNLIYIIMNKHGKMAAVIGVLRVC